MAASISERFRAAVQACLLAAPQIDGVADRVDRAREDARSADEVSGINIAAADEPSKRQATTVNDKELHVDIQIFVRATGAEVWETVADAIDVAVAARLAAYTSWPIDRPIISETGREWTADEGDDTRGKLTLSYAIRFLNQAGDITAAA
jgi:hypothetical protein